MSEKIHDCPHPVDEFDWADDGKPLTVWVCKECGMIWEAHCDIYWAPAEDDRGEPLRLMTHKKPD